MYFALNFRWYVKYDDTRGVFNRLWMETFGAMCTCLNMEFRKQIYGKMTVKAVPRCRRCTKYHSSNHSFKWGMGLCDEIPSYIPQNYVMQWAENFVCSSIVSFWCLEGHRNVTLIRTRDKLFYTPSGSNFYRRLKMPIWSWGTGGHFSFLNYRHREVWKLFLFQERLKW